MTRLEGGRSPLTCRSLAGDFLGAPIVGVDHGEALRGVSWEVVGVLGNDVDRLVGATALDRGFAQDVPARDRVEVGIVIDLRPLEVGRLEEQRRPEAQARGCEIRGELEGERPTQLPSVRTGRGCQTRWARNPWSARGIARTRRRWCVSGHPFGLGPLPYTKAVRGGVIVIDSRGSFHLTPARINRPSTGRPLGTRGAL